MKWIYYDYYENIMKWIYYEYYENYNYKIIHNNCLILCIFYEKICLIISEYMHNKA